MVAWSAEDARGADAAFVGAGSPPSRSDAHLSVQTSTAAPGFLVTSDVYYLGWQASVDGASTPLYRADYVLRGVAVPAGEHVVRFDFRPRIVYLGTGLSGASALVLAAVAASGARRDRRDRRDRRRP